MVLDLTSGRLADAIMHAQRALESVDARLSELKEGLTGTLKPAEAPTPAEDIKVDVKGKGKATGAKLVRDDLVQNMSRAQIEAEVKDLSELREDLALKVSVSHRHTVHCSSSQSADICWVSG